MTTLLPITQQLITLSNHTTLSAMETEYLALLINQLFVDLEAGNSCSRLDNLSNIIAVSPAKILKILTRTSLVTLYRQVPDRLAATPITVLNLNNDCLIYVSKYLYYELDIAKRVTALTVAANLDGNTQYIECCRLLKNIQGLNNIPNIEQLQAMQNALGQKFSIITGGPGSGKTTTITLLLWVLYRVYGADLKIKICAPTGKASKRVKQSIENSIANFQSKQSGIFHPGLDRLLADNNSFVTIHKLLGYCQYEIYFTHNQDQPLDIDVLVIDESSMLGLALFSKLLQAIDSNTIKHIIFLGDKNQLFSVEEGSVFAAMVNSTRTKHKQNDLFSVYQIGVISELLSSNRNIGDVSILAQAVLTNDITQLDKVLTTSNQIKIIEPKLEKILYLVYKPLLNYIDYINNMDMNILDIKDVFKQYNQQILLCLTNVGWLGSINLNQLIENKIKQHNRLNSLWYNGRPIIILENDYSLGLSNGDIGICITSNGVTKIIFDGVDYYEIIPEALPKHALAYAISIHKSQGSEYEHVNLLIPPQDSHDGHNMCTRELIYTAVTRAKRSVTIFSTCATIWQGLNNATVRNTGLNHFLF